jgi:hypothetical protein
MGSRGIILLGVAFALVAKPSKLDIRKARHFEANLRSNCNGFRKVFEQPFRNILRSLEAASILELPEEAVSEISLKGQSQLHK